jgi:hypothetical protein
MLAACNGIGLMLQYGNPIATFARVQCTSGVFWLEGLYDFMLAVTVDAALTKKICVDSAGHDFHSYIMDYGYSWAPLPMQPVFMSWYQQRTDSDVVCKSMLDRTKSNMRNSMQPWFTVQFESAEALVIYL